MSARSTRWPSFSETYCCLRREPSLSSMLKRTVAELSVAECSLTGIDTRPNERESDAIERAAMRSSHRCAGPARGDREHTGNARALSSRGVASRRRRSAAFLHGRRSHAERLHAARERLPGRPVVGPRVARLEAEVLARGQDRPLCAALQRRHLLPRDRHRDAEPGARTRRERRRRRLEAAVAQVVDEDPADAVAAAALGDE